MPFAEDMDIGVSNDDRDACQEMCDLEYVLNIYLNRTRALVNDFIVSFFARLRSDTSGQFRGIQFEAAEKSVWHACDKLGIVTNRDSQT
jgi:hypothetical protein